MELVLISTILVAVLGVGLGLIIGAVAKAFEVQIDPRIEEIAAMLPNANCGACGRAGCLDFSKAIVNGEIVDVARCPVCSSEVRSAISGLMGLADSPAIKKVAVVLCGGDRKSASRSALYNGVSDCRSANLIAGAGKGCRFGCLSLGSCARICPFAAIEMTADGLALVHPELCVACGKCIDACPRGIIKLVPAEAKVHILCSSTDKGPAKKKVCNVPCIGCRKCVKAAGDDKMTVQGFLVQVNYENPPGIDIIEKSACPTGCLRAAPPDENHKTMEVA